MSVRSFSEYRDTPLWTAVEEVLAELVASHEVTVNTAPEYVIEQICRELVAKKLVVPAGGSTP